jgi:hypothetical protein
VRVDFRHKIPQKKLYLAGMHGARWGENQSAAGAAHERLVFFPGVDPRHELLNRLRLIACRLEGGLKIEHGV